MHCDVCMSLKLQISTLSFQNICSALLLCPLHILKDVKKDLQISCVNQHGINSFQKMWQRVSTCITETNLERACMHTYLLMYSIPSAYRRRSLVGMAFWALKRCDQNPYNSRFIHGKLRPNFHSHPASQEGSIKCEMFGASEVLLTIVFANRMRRIGICNTSNKFNFVKQFQGKP